MTSKIYFRVLAGALALLILGAVYVFQRSDFFYGLLKIAQGSDADIHPNLYFIISRTSRLIINDLACFLLIWAIFQERRYLRVAWYVFLFEIVVLLPFYFIVKLSLEGASEISSPLLSQIHRMIINPTLMILLMAGFFYQNLKFSARKK